MNNLRLDCIMRVMTYNIRGGLGMDGRRDTARIAGVVAEWQPDVVCLQEVHQRLPQSGFVDQPQRLQKSLGMVFSFQANLHIGIGGYGVGVLSQYPVRSVRHHRLPSRGEQRGALEVWLETPTGVLTVFCTHWGLNSDERARQAAALGELVGTATRPVILCGDLNDVPETDDIQRMLQQTDLADLGATENLPTYPTDSPRARIDVIFASPCLRAERVTIVDTQASDHLPLVADLTWTR